MELKKFSQEEETLIVKNAMELTATVMFEEMELQKTREEKFRTTPAAPVHEVLPIPAPVAPQYPPQPSSTYSYGAYLKDFFTALKPRLKIIIPVAAAVFILTIILFATSLAARIYLTSLFIMLLLCGVPAFVIVTFCMCNKKRSRLDQQLAQSEEYLQARKLAEQKAEEATIAEQKQIQQRQAELDIKYKQEKEHYDTVILPAYNADLDTWKVVREKKIAFLQEEIANNKQALEEVYQNSKIISLSYRELSTLKWIYDDMSSSDHDIRYATELFDRDRQRIATLEGAKLTEAAINSMSAEMAGSMNAIYDAIEQGNDLQEDTINVLSKTRRDQNIGNILGIVQRHNTNKTLKSMLK